ncbi:MAG: hypothetical protein IPL40_08980 [Proteobacteria bacterium]|nr:hypothetical protein [Pseudomonadota bacterium]
MKVAIDGRMSGEEREALTAKISQIFKARAAQPNNAQALQVELVPAQVAGVTRHSISRAIREEANAPQRNREHARRLVSTTGERIRASASAMPANLAAIPGAVANAASGAAQAALHPRAWWAEKQAGAAQQRNEAFGAVWGFGWTLVDVGLWLGVVGGGPGVTAFALSMGLNHIWSVWPNQLNDAFAYGAWTRILFGTEGGTRTYAANDLLMEHFGLGPAFSGGAQAAKKTIAGKLGLSMEDVDAIVTFPAQVRAVGGSGATETLTVQLNIGEIRKRRAEAHAAMAAQSSEHRGGLAEVLAAAGGDKWEAVQSESKGAATAEDKRWAGLERAVEAIKRVDDQANELGRAVAASSGATERNPWKRIGVWIEGSALRKGQIAHLANGSFWMLAFLELSYMGGLSSFGALSLPALAIVATAVPASLICSSGFWGSQVMNRQHLVTSQGRWVFSLVGDTFFRINAKIAQTGNLWLWAAAMASEFGWAGYRFANGLVGQREGPPQGVVALLTGLGRVVRAEASPGNRADGDNSCGVVALVHASAVQPDPQVLQADPIFSQIRDAPERERVAERVAGYVAADALYRLGVETVGRGTPLVPLGEQEGRALARMSQGKLTNPERARQAAWVERLTPQSAIPTHRTLWAARAKRVGQAIRGELGRLRTPTVPWTPAFGGAAP